jgi:hypothetical protein
VRVSRRLGIEDPTVRIGYKLVALEQGGGCVGMLVRWEEEEDVVGGYGQVDDYVTVLIFVGACYVTVEALKGQRVEKFLRPRPFEHTIVGAQPYDILRLPIPSRHDSVPLVLFWVPGKMVPTLF